ncbi:MAG: isoaspartyl peptidase/L-asparaginase [Myxococcota bacterium]
METGFSLVVHGGAGRLSRQGLSEARRQSIEAGLAAALRIGGEILAGGGSALDAVTAAAVSLEDDPNFNAGRGAVLCIDGTVEMDASIMDGDVRDGGAVAAVKGVKNPILLARAVMEKTPHLLLVGGPAVRFAQEQGIPLATSDYFVTGLRRQQWRDARRQIALGADGLGTIGAVARDRRGRLAAATSTGGMTNQQLGRVGDSALLGAGTWARNETCAVSATGHGERFILANAAARLSDLIELGGMSLAAAAERLVNEELVRMDARGGLIAVDASGNVSMPFNSGGMLRGVLIEGQRPAVGIWEQMRPLES